VLITGSTSDAPEVGNLTIAQGINRIRILLHKPKKVSRVGHSNGAQKLIHAGGRTEVHVLCTTSYSPSHTSPVSHNVGSTALCDTGEVREGD